MCEGLTITMNHNGKACDKFDNIYDFNQTSISTQFQQKNLSDKRFPTYESSNFEQNYLPSICLSKSLNSNGLFNVKILFNDFIKNFIFIK